MATSSVEVRHTKRPTATHAVYTNGEVYVCVTGGFEGCGRQNGSFEEAEVLL